MSVVEPSAAVSKLRLSRRLVDVGEAAAACGDSWGRREVVGLVLEVVGDVSGLVKSKQTRNMRMKGREGNNMNKDVNGCCCLLVKWGLSEDEGIKTSGISNR